MFLLQNNIIINTEYHTWLGQIFEYISRSPATLLSRCAPRRDEALSYLSQSSKFAQQNEKPTLSCLKTSWLHIGNMFPTLLWFQAVVSYSCLTIRVIGQHQKTFPLKLHLTSTSVNRSLCPQKSSSCYFFKKCTARRAGGIFATSRLSAYYLLPTLPDITSSSGCDVIKRMWRHQADVTS